MLSEKSAMNHTKPKITVTPYSERMKQEIRTVKGMVRKRINIWEGKSPEKKVNPPETTPESFYNKRKLEKEKKYLEASIGTYSECFSFLQDRDPKHPASSSRLSILWSQNNKSYPKKIIGEDNNDKTNTSIECDSSCGRFSLLNFTNEGSMNDPYYNYDHKFMQRSFDYDKFHKDTYTNEKIKIDKFHDEAFIWGIDNKHVFLDEYLNGVSRISNNIMKDNSNLEEYKSLKKDNGNLVEYRSLTNDYCSLDEYKSLLTSTSTTFSFHNKKKNKGNYQENAKEQTKTSPSFQSITKYFKDILLFILIVQYGASALFSQNGAC